MADERIPADAVEFQLVIRHNVVSQAFEMSGHSKNFLVAMGMLRYAQQMLSMEIAQARVVEQMKNAPRIALPGGLPQ